MKKIYTILFSLLLLAGIDGAHAQRFLKTPGKTKGKSSTNKTSKLRTTAVKKLPQKAQNYYWDDLEGTWIEAGHSEYTYDLQGNLLRELKTNAYGDSSERLLSSYDSYGHKISYIYQYYNLNQWINSQKESYSYDSYGNLVETIAYMWLGNQWETAWGYKQLFTYDSQDRITEIIYQDYDNSEAQWLSNWKTGYTYTGSHPAPTAITDYEYTNNEWTKTSEFTDIVWRNFDNSILIDEDLASHIESSNVYDYSVDLTGRISSTVTENTTVLLSEINEEDHWIPFQRSTVVVQENAIVTTYENFEDGEWKFYSKETEYTDSKGEYAGYTSEIYESGEWVLYYSDLITNTYNENDEKVQTVSEINSPGNSVYKEKKVFSDFITVDPVTGAASSVTFASLKVYPNPATDIILFENIPAGAELSIATTGNQIVLSKRVTETSARITVADLQPGVYFATIRSASGETKTMKFIKQ